jgi:V8-like Glu-specific endopeptidase
VGTGFLINPQFALTAAHVIWDKKNQRIMKKLYVYTDAYGEIRIG